MSAYSCGLPITGTGLTASGLVTQNREVQFDVRDGFALRLEGQRATADTMHVLVNPAPSELADWIAGRAPMADVSQVRTLTFAERAFVLFSGEYRRRGGYRQLLGTVDSRKVLGLGQCGA